MKLLMLPLTCPPEYRLIGLKWSLYSVAVVMVTRENHLLARSLNGIYHPVEFSAIQYKQQINLKSD